MDAFCQVRMKSQDAAARQSFKTAMEAEPTILEVYAITGEWDYLVHILVRDMADFESVLMRCIHDHAAVANTATTFALRRVKHATAVPV